MRKYYTARGLNPFDFLPLSYHVKNGINDIEFHSFQERFEQNKKNSRCQNIWIVKPGENTNQGRGIVLCNMLEQVKEIVR
jgi:tubulin--tyrosine ligase